MRGRLVALLVVSWFADASVAGEGGGDGRTWWRRSRASTTTHELCLGRKEKDVDGCIAKGKGCREAGGVS